jgi:hypothetical protein
VNEILKYMPEKYLKFHTLLTQFRTRSEGVFLDSFTSGTYLLISPKSLYPFTHHED